MVGIYVWSPIFAYVGSAIVASDMDSQYAICPFDCQPRRGGGPARDGVPPPTLPYLPPLCPAVVTTTQSVDGSYAGVAHM